MKDKEEQINEMAKEICSHCLEMAEVCPYANTEDESGNKACFTERLHEAEKFYNAGYRKIPEDSVVLSREEYIDLSRNYVGEQVAQTRKETAGKIYTFVNSFGTHNWERFEEFIKQFGVKIKG